MFVIAPAAVIFSEMTIKIIKVRRCRRRRRWSLGANRVWRKLYVCAASGAQIAAQWHRVDVENLHIVSANYAAGGRAGRN
jgi:hypothetical protein